VTANLVWKQHNKYRRLAGMPKLSSSKKLSKDCEDYAKVSKIFNCFCALNNFFLKHLVTLNIPDQELFWIDKPLPINITYFLPDVEDHIAYPFSDKNKIYCTESICEFKSVSCVGRWYYEGRTAYRLSK